jgi:hypothetical protein
MPSRAPLTGWTRLLLVGAAALCPTQVEAQSRQTAGSVTLEVPTGWDRHEMAGAIVYIPREDRTAAGLHVLPGEEVRGDFRAWFEGHWRAFLRGRRTLGEQIFEEAMPSGMRGLAALALLDAHPGEPAYIVFFAAIQGSRAQPILAAFRDRAAMDRFDDAVQRAHASVRLLSPNQRPPPRVLALSTVLSGSPLSAAGRTAPAQPNDPMAMLRDVNRKEAAQQAERTGRMTAPERLLGSSWRVARYDTSVNLDGSSWGTVTVFKELFLERGGAYEYISGAEQGGRVSERGRYEIRGDQLILTGQSAMLTRGGSTTRLAPRTHRFTWSFGHDPELEDLGRSVPMMNLNCPGAAHCYAMLYLRDANGREEMWRQR